MVTRRGRSRLSRVLVDLAWERFYACEVCWESEASDSIEDVLTPLRLKQRESKRLFQRLSCPSCESRVGAGTLVVAPTSEQLRQSRLSRRFDSLYRSELEAFRDFLVEYPMLGAEHPFGKLLLKAMRRAREMMLQPSIWYRATSSRREPNFEPPRHQGEAIRAYRFNQIGQVVWYLGCDEKTAAVEKLRAPKSGEPICIAKIKILEPISVLDLRSALWGEDPTGEWILRNVVDRRFISEPTPDIDDSRPQYRVPQFVADLARKKKFGGILYDSTRPSAYNNPEAVGHNLVVFDPFPAHATESYTTLVFGEPDFDVMSGSDRWPLRPVPSP
jgi:RES domain